jgi:hypothetical protein
MTDRIEVVVEKIIRYTEEILATRTAHWRTARTGLIKMLGNMEQTAPDHAAVEALRRFIAETDAAYREKDIH